MIMLAGIMTKNGNKGKHEKHLKRHKEEVEELIRNFSMGMNLRTHIKPSHSSSKVLSPYTHNGLSMKAPSKYFKEEHHKKAANIIHESDKNEKSDRIGMDAHWQAVDGMSHKFFVYSAYYDTRDTQKPVVRVIGVTRTKRSDKVLCRMYNNEARSSDVNETSSYISDRRSNSTSFTNEGVPQPFRDVTANIFIIRENWNLKYSACFVICPLKSPISPGSNEEFIPNAVSILPKMSTTNAIHTNRLPVLNYQNGGTGTYQVNKTDIGVCVKPIHFHYNKTYELIEFIELNKILGVTKFTFYNHTMSDDVSCVLNYYMNQENVVSVKPWNLEVDSQTEIRTEGLFAALNDCLYRNMNDFHYLMLIDFDEFIIPHMNDSIPDMLEYLNSKKVVMKNGRKLTHPKLTSSYSFQNAFFYLQFGKNLINHYWFYGILNA